MSAFLSFFGPEELRRDIYFQRDFIDLHARNGTIGLSDGDFSHHVGIVPIPGSGRNDLETPWGYGGPIVPSAELLPKGLAKWKDYVRREVGAVAEFIRLHPFLDPSIFADHVNMLQFNRHVVVADLNVSRDLRWRNYSDSTKNCIRKASRTLELHRIGAEAAEEFGSIYELGLTRNDASSDYYFDKQFYQKLLDAPWATTWMVTDSQGAAAVSCFLHGSGDLCHYHLAGANEKARRANAHYFLLDVALDHFSALGVRYMMLGGGRTTDNGDALLRFKSKFSPLLASYCVAGIIYDHDSYANLGGGISKFLCTGVLNDAASSARCGNPPAD